MRSKRGHGEPALERALSDLARALNAAGVPWMVIGGIAVIARGVRRMTTDIDVTVRGDRIEVAPLLRILADRRIVPRIKDAERFASESLVLLLRHEPTGVELDVSMAWTDFEWEALEESTLTAFGAVKAPMATSEALIVFKAIAGRPKDLEDAITLLGLYRDIDRARVRERVRQLAELVDDPGLVSGLEAAITASAKVPPTTRERDQSGRPSSKIRRRTGQAAKSQPKPRKPR